MGENCNPQKRKKRILSSSTLKSNNTSITIIVCYLLHVIILLLWGNFTTDCCQLFGESSIHASTVFKNSSVSLFLNKITKCFRESNDVPKRDFVIVLSQNGLMETEFSQHVYCSLTTVS